MGFFRVLDMGGIITLGGYQRGVSVEFRGLMGFVAILRCLRGVPLKITVYRHKVDFVRFRSVYGYL